MRLAVTGANGQVARALQALQTPGLDIIAVARPEFDLMTPDTIMPALRAAGADVIVNAAAYTQVDAAESDYDAALAANGRGAGAVAEAAAMLGAPLIQLSTDYVFDGAKTTLYAETDSTSPCNAYGASKLAGERAVAAAQPDHAIVRVAWIYAPYGANFVRTMLRLAESREEIAVVSDQRGGPTSALDLAAAIGRIGANLAAQPTAPELRGVFHLAPEGEASWAELAEAIFAESVKRGGPSARVRPIPSADYPTPAKRPSNSRLDASKLSAAHGVRLPHWRVSLAACLDRLIGPERMS